MNAAALVPLQRVFYLAANLMLVLLGLRLAGRWTQIRLLQSAGAKMFGAVVPAIKPLLQRPGLTGRVVLGLVWGLVPCALVYSVLPLALFAGGPMQGRGGHARVRHWHHAQSLRDGHAPAAQPRMARCQGVSRDGGGDAGSIRAARPLARLHG